MNSLQLSRETNWSMVRFRVGSRGARINLLFSCLSLFGISTYVLFKAITGEHIRVEGFETKERGRETIRTIFRPESSYEDVQKRLMERREKEMQENQEKASDLNLKQFFAKTNTGLNSNDSFEIRIRRTDSRHQN